MQRTLLAALSLLTALLLPFAAAQDANDAPDQVGVDVDVDEGDGGMDATDDGADSAEESTFAGLSTTVVIILIVLAVLVVALIVAMASRP